MPPYILRLAFTIEFLVALVAIPETWNIGGQGHFEYMPWFAKVGFVLGLALVTVMGTAASMAHERAWNAKTMACLLLAAMLVTGMGVTSYYYHLHENDDQAQGGDDASITLLLWPEMGR
jgi:Ni/Fe-hydrogenase subunit HybB-like protein